MLALALSLTALSGCNPVSWWSDMRAPEIFVQDGSAATLRGPHRVKVWAHDQSGKLVRGYVTAHDRWLVCPPGPDTNPGSSDSPDRRETPDSGQTSPAGMAMSAEPDELLAEIAPELTGW